MADVPPGEIQGVAAPRVRHVDGRAARARGRLMLLRAGAALPRHGTGNWYSYPAVVKCVERMRTAGGWKAYEEAYVTIFKKIFPRSPLPRLLVLRVTCYWARMGLSGSPYLPPSLLA